MPFGDHPRLDLHEVAVVALLLEVVGARSHRQPFTLDAAMQEHAGGELGLQNRALLHTELCVTLCVEVEYGYESGN